MHFTCVNQISLCALENYADTPIGFITLSLIASLAIGGIVIKLLF